MQIIFCDDAKELLLSEIAKSILVAESKLFGWKLVKNKINGKLGMVTIKELREIVSCV
jgi:hypothetical protein